jgi:hypothetical protein
MSFQNQRNLINTNQRKKIEKGLETLRIVINVIKHYKEQNIPPMSFLHLVELEETLEEMLLKDGLPEKRLEEIKEELT